MKQVTNGQCVQFLNELLALDKKAIEDLFAYYVPCNKALADHPTVQVWKTETSFQVSLLGILNGLFGVLENSHWGTISKNCDRETNQKIERFSIITEEMVEKWTKKSEV